jgi:iron complex transport system ATP-binding protein
MLEIENLSAGYGKRDVLNIAQLAFAPGQVSVIIGPNGSGKSTLLRCLAAMLRPHRGALQINGGNIHRMPARELARLMAYVPQEISFPFSFTAAELVSMGAAAGGGAGDEAQRRAGEALALFELTEIADKSLTALSGGERQRAALARALAQNTRWLLLDEPTAHLDLRHQAVLRETVRHIAREENRATVLVLHDLNLAASYADRVILLDEGRVAAEGTPASALTPETLARVYNTEVYLAQDSVSGQQWFATKPPRAHNHV